jgi:hypothetical protein
MDSKKQDIEKTKTCAAMIAEAQGLYDSDNWGNLNTSGSERLRYLRAEYKKIRGVDMQLTYNCPA